MSAAFMFLREGLRRNQEASSACGRRDASLDPLGFLLDRGRVFSASLLTAAPERCRREINLPIPNGFLEFRVLDSLRRESLRCRPRV
jgi:hypothetical protein